MSQVSDIWMFIFNEGAATTKEISNHIERHPDLFHGPIRDMEKKGQIVRIPRCKEEEKPRVKFTITGECLIPAGVKLKDILK